jgi:IclR family acetate operon transcriptional repressor
VNVKQAAYVLDLLDFFATHQRPASLAEIAKHFGWPRSSTFNLLGTLSQRGFLYEPRSRGGYYPAPIWATLVQNIERAQPISEAMHALLRHLAAETGETAVLAAVSGANALFVAAIESKQAIRYTAAAGRMIPLHVTATGRALLSQMTPEERGALLRKAEFERYTPTTLMSVADVESEVRRSIERGWCEGNAEYTPDLGGVALPLPLPDRHLAVLVAGPMFRVHDRSAELAALMRKAIERFVQ